VIWANRKKSDSLILGRKGGLDFSWESLRNIARMGIGGVGSSDYSQNGREVSLEENSPLRSLLSELNSLLFSSSPAFFHNSFITLPAVY